jgi:hypothetical protein
VSNHFVQAYIEREGEKTAHELRWQEQRGRDALKHFASMMGIEADGVVTDAGGAVVRLGDLSARYSSGQYDSWFEVGGVCPECGERAWSASCWNPADVGKQLLAFEPCREHRQRCPAKTRPLPWRERLRLAWRTLKEGR